MKLGIAAVAIVLLIGLIAVVPTRTVGLDSRASPARSYAEAVGRIGQRQAADDVVAAPGGRSIFMTHGAPTARAVLLFHGFTNSPRQYEHLAALLFAAGDNVYVPRLPHHAERNGNAGTLSSLTAEELRACADATTDIARGLGDSVVVAGVSAGGTIAAWVAQNRPDVHRVVIVSPVFAIGRVPSFLDRPLMNLALRLPNVTRNEPADSSRPDRELGVSTRAIAQILRLGVAVREQAEVTPPRVHDIVFVLNGNDHTVKEPPALTFARRWTDEGARVFVYEFPRSLALPHDIAEEAHPNANPAIVYPALSAFILGEPVPPLLARHRLWPQ